MMRVLKNGNRLLILVTVIIFLVSAFNILVFFSGIISGGSGVGLKFNQTSTGDYVLRLSVNPTNKGFLGVDLSTRLTILDVNGNVIDSNSTFINVPPGQSRFAQVSLTIPLSMIPGGDLQNVKASVQLELDARTLWGLVGFKNVLRAGGGQ
jgi:hypothetical protein